MNRKQGVVFFASCILIGLIWMFPRWTIYVPEHDLYHESIGFHFRFQEPIHQIGKDVYRPTMDNNSVYCLTVVTILVTLFAHVALKTQHKYLTDAMVPAKNDTIGQIGRLLETLKVGNRYTRPQTKSELTVLLTSLRPVDAPHITAMQRAVLQEAIQHSHRERETDFILAGLSALGQIGDAATMIFLQEYLTVPKLLPDVLTSKKKLRIRQAALDSLRMLKAREQEEARILVRASEAPLQANSLLRPASSGTGENTATLLRAIGAQSPGKQTKTLASRQVESRKYRKKGNAWQKRGRKTRHAR